MSDHNIWPGLTYDDALAARAWLAGLGFEEGHCYVDEDDPTVVTHSEMVWPEGGRVMVSSRKKADTTFASERGGVTCYIVTDDPRPAWARAQELGATVIRELSETDYGSSDFAVTDAEGNRWSFGTYAG